jgi:hypothetical protein
LGKNFGVDMTYRYKKITTPDGRRMDEHRYIMEQRLGRKLEFNEVVHHNDNDSKNNDEDTNLELKSRSKHASDHMKEIWQSGRVSCVYHPVPRLKLRRLTQEQADQIRVLNVSGFAQRKLANMFGVGRQCIRRILANETYVL